MNIRTLAVAPLTLFFLLAGCDRSEDTGQTEVAGEAAEINSAEQHRSPEIQWYDGGVEEAFADAKDAGAPVFLYWGAVWCPPCQEIKSTVFKSNDFIELTRQFIPVYLDGDTDRAQAWGEKFGVKGYPTMIVFNPQGEEITRIPGGIDISRYNTVLGLSLEQMRPTTQLVEYALNDIEKLTPEDYYQLAYYSWSQDFTALPEDADKAAMFYQLSNGTDNAELSARFYMWYLSSVADENQPAEDGSDPELPLQPGDDLSARLLEVLASDELTLACWDTLAYYMDDVLAIPVLDEAQKAELETAWSRQMFSLRNHESLSKSERMAGWVPKLTLLTRDDQVIDETLASQLREELRAVDADTPDSFERQSVINQMSQIYRLAGLNENTTVLLTAELEKSASPYYFMSGLAAYAERDQDFEEALKWRRQAYETATGEATRFQWGANYVRAMIRLSPADEESILAAASSLLQEFHDADEMFAGRNFRVLRRLNQELTTWQEDYDVEALPFSSTVASMCATQAEGTQEQENCSSLAAKVGSA